ncbi:hypothetical protein [Micromonospora sp. WMMD736]|uniref:hypothetical protein n=1 Tax=Micromonospora sp. WMMD736 TaxID=3404112 RepID=UPI003B92720C
MVHVPTHHMRVSVDGEPAISVAAPVTIYNPSNDYNSGDYEAYVGEVLLRYSACGFYRATYQGVRQGQAAPRYGSGESVTFDFTKYGGPRIQIVND